MARFKVRGKMSVFGGMSDRGKGMTVMEGLALYDEKTAKGTDPYGTPLFVPEAQRPDNKGCADWLNEAAYYIACRWKYRETSRSFLKMADVWVTNVKTGAKARARPTDWGPNERTGRVADLSPGLAKFLSLKTDDEVEVEIA